VKLVKEVWVTSLQHVKLETTRNWSVVYLEGRVRNGYSSVDVKLSWLN